MIRAVLFDLGNTLVSYYRKEEFRPILERCLVEVGEIAGMPDDVDALLASALELNREAADHAVRPLAGRLHKLFPALRDSQDETLDGACRAFMKPIFTTAVVMDGAFEVLEAFRTRGLRTAIVSNTPWGSPAQLWREELARHGLLDRVDASVFCVDVGWRKPHPAPFQAALATLDVDPHDAVFVGDDPRWDVAGAERAGIRPILLSTGPAGEVATLRRLTDLLESHVIPR